MANLNLNHIKDTETKNTLKDLYYKINIHEKSSRSFVSQFLNPAVQKQIKPILENSKIKYEFVGGSDQAERKVLVLGEIFDSPIKIYYFDSKGEDIGHRDVLGSLIGLGIAREDIGDIVANKERIEFAVSANIDQMILPSRIQVSKFPVDLCLKDGIDLQISDRENLELKASIASLRLDCIISEMARTSRAKGQDLIKSGKVKLNHVEERSVDVPIEEGDIFSIRGIGRFTFKEIVGRSKKDRFIINYIKKG